MGGAAFRPLPENGAPLFTIDGGVCVGIDNHKPKGPHLHHRADERQPRALDEDELLATFWKLVRQEGFEP